MIYVFVKNRQKKKEKNWFVNTTKLHFYLVFNKLTLPDASGRDLMFAISDLYFIRTGKPCSFKL